MRLRGGGGSAPFLDEASAHSSDRYWLLKTICLNNLYGVDLMGEAAEIAKLRLFLKLAAQLDDAMLMEPLPDLDFNIKSGNLLVGIADPDDAQQRFGASLLSAPGLATAEEAAQQAAEAYDAFAAAQLAETADGAFHSSTDSGKAQLMAQIDAARNLADGALYDLRDELVGFEQWRESHQPFHWFAEFPSVWRDRGHGRGFDVIIGNPPYVKPSAVDEYTWQGYKTQTCPDLYAVCTERASTLLNDQGRFAMIVMHSICFHKGFKVLRDCLTGIFPSLWVSSYSRIPDGLFSGSARVRNSIIIAARFGSSGLSTSRCRRWLTEGRGSLFGTQQYVRANAELLRCGDTPQWLFLDDRGVAGALAGMVEGCQPLEEVLDRGGTHAVGYKTVAQYSLGIYTQEPPTVNLSTGMPAATVSERSKWLYFGEQVHRDLAFIVLSGRWAYLWWLAYGDEFHVTRGVLAALPCDIERLASTAASGGLPSDPPCDMELVTLVKDLLACSEVLQDEMPKHLKWKANAGVNVGRFDLRVPECRAITDEADWLLAQAWGLTREQYEAAGNLRDRMTFGHKGD